MKVEHLLDGADELRDVAAGASGARRLVAERAYLGRYLREPALQVVVACDARQRLLAAEHLGQLGGALGRLALQRLPLLLLALDHGATQLAHVELQLRQVEQQVEHLVGVELKVLVHLVAYGAQAFAHLVCVRGRARVACVQNGPLEGAVGLSQEREHLVGVDEQVVVGEEALVEVGAHLGRALGEAARVQRRMLAYVDGGERVGQSAACALVAVPGVGQVDDERAHVDAEHPVVGKELVDYFAHHGRLRVQYVGAEVEQHVEHGRLVGERVAAMLRLRVHAVLVVEVVGAQAADALADDLGVDGKAGEERLGVVGRLGSGVWPIAGAAEQFAHVVHVGVHVGALRAVAYVADEHVLAHAALELDVDDEEHEAVEVERLDEQLLAVGVEQYRVDILLDVDALVEVLEEATQVARVLVYALEGQVEAVEYVQVVELELVVERLQLGLGHDRVLVVGLVAQVAEVEQHLGVLVGRARPKRRRYVVAEAEELGDDGVAASHQPQLLLSARNSEYMTRTWKSETKIFT